MRKEFNAAKTLAESLAQPLSKNPAHLNQFRIFATRFDKLEHTLKPPASSAQDGIMDTLSEFATTAMKKSKSSLTQIDVNRIVEMLTREIVIPIDAFLVQLALHRVQQSRLSYWDALIVEAALRSGASILYTEDMHHGTRYGPLELRDPFLA